MLVRAFLIATVATFALAACSGNEGEMSRDAGTMSAEDAAIEDAATDASLPPPPQCACEDQEDCAACMRHIGECCYDDETIEGMAALIAASCERDSACKGCCNECVGWSCDQLKARNACPNLE